jgi:hypothetical protein
VALLEKVVSILIPLRDRNQRIAAFLAAETALDVVFGDDALMAILNKIASELET